MKRAAAGDARAGARRVRGRGAPEANDCFPRPPSPPRRRAVPAPTPAGRTVALPGAPEGIALSPSRGLAALAVRRPPRLVIVATATGRVVRRVRFPPARATCASAGRAAPCSSRPRRPTHCSRSASTDASCAAAPPGASRTTPSPPAARSGSLTSWTEPCSVVRDGHRQVVRGLVQPGGIAATVGRVAAVDVRGATTSTVYDARSEARVARLAAGRGPTHAEASRTASSPSADTRGGAVLLYSLRGRPRRVARVSLGGRALRPGLGRAAPATLGSRSPRATRSSRSGPRAPRRCAGGHAAHRSPAQQRRGRSRPRSSAGRGGPPAGRLQIVSVGR